jgi:uncharacterized repeat protein (TIGR03803 family)
MTNSVQVRGWISGMRMREACIALMLAAVGASQSSQAQTFTVLHNFTGGNDGGNPSAGLVRDKAGNLYGTTVYGNAGECELGCGLVFEVDTSGTETVLYGFQGGTDGAYPYAGLIRDAAGNLYGTTFNGGSSDNGGTVFKVDTSGTETVLHNFTGGTTDGCHPEGGLLRDKAGNLYGTTQACGASRYGTVFKMDTSGTETVLHSFAGGTTDGAYPVYTSLLMDKNGNLYGVTEYGGASGEGVVYMLSSSGTLTVLHNFTGYPDGCYPNGTPARDKKGNLYGTANACGSSNLGIVWKVSKKGTETVLHNFTGYPTDGGNPYAGVIIDAKGNLYGDASQGGTSDAGVVYKLSKSKTLTVLHNFTRSDGQFLVGGVIRDGKGNLYGTTYGGGSYSYGTAWKLTR